jgi:hypothetical protein
MRYGLFNQGKSEPIEEYEGDDSHMKTPPFVEIYKYGDSTKVVAHIHLGPGQSVREIEDAPAQVRDIGEFRQLGGSARRLGCQEATAFNPSR